jgi:hypothetical protein
MRRALPIVVLLLVGCHRADPPSTATIKHQNNPDIAVSVARAEIAFPMYRDSTGRQHAGDETCLEVFVTILNNSQVRKYVSWSETPRTVTLKDEHGNSYRMSTFGDGAKVFWEKEPGSGKGYFTQIGADSIHPGKSLTDVLVFEKPIAAAKTLTLALPGWNLRQEGDSYELAIATAAIKPVK